MHQHATEILQQVDWRFAIVGHQRIWISPRLYEHFDHAQIVCVEAAKDSGNQRVLLAAVPGDRSACRQQHGHTLLRLLSLRRFS